MTSLAHALAALAAASLVPGVADASQRGDALPWLAAAFAGMLPDALEWLSRTLARADVLYTPDPLAGEKDNRRGAELAVAAAALRALASDRPVRLRIRPLPSSCGVLVACIRRDALPDGMPPFPPVWPADLHVRSPDGALLEFHPAPGSRSLARIVVRAHGRGRGRAHSAILLVGGAAALLWTGDPVCGAAGAALAAHAALDALGTQGIPLWRRNGRIVVARRCPDTAAASRVAAALALAALAASLALQTAYLGHPRRVIATGLLATAAFLATLLSLRKRQDATVRP